MLTSALCCDNTACEVVRPQAMDAKEETKKTFLTEPIKILIGKILALVCTFAVWLLYPFQNWLATKLSFSQLLGITGVCTSLLLLLTPYILYLRRKIKTLTDWESQMVNYNLTEIAEGAFVYAFNQPETTRLPTHWLCVRCFDEKQKSVLQRTELTGQGTIYHCSKCNSNVVDHRVKKQWRAS